MKIRKYLFPDLQDLTNAYMQNAVNSELKRHIINDYADMGNIRMKTINQHVTD